MEFNSNAFMKAKYEPRTASISVPVLTKYCTGDDYDWVVRGQTANELARTIEAAAMNDNISNIVAAIGENKDQIEALKKAVGISDDVPGDIIKRLNQLVTCSVSPVVDRRVAIKLAETFPIEFYQLTNKITELTGLGMEAAVKKPKPSGETLKSDAA